MNNYIIGKINKTKSTDLVECFSAFNGFAIYRMNKFINCRYRSLIDLSYYNKDDLKKDYEYTRANLYSLIEKGQEAINGILELAQESEMPRAYEVAGQLIKNTSEIAEKLMALHKLKKDVEEEKTKGPTTVNNALFVGSTAELAKLLKQQTQDENV